jgi:hypothetical protein
MRPGVEILSIHTRIFEAAASGREDGDYTASGVSPLDSFSFGIDAR